MGAEGYIQYKAGYKYVLFADYTQQTTIVQPLEINTNHITLKPDGTLLIEAGYAWDGPSGPTLDTKNFMRGSLVHDALYQLIAEGYLSRVEWREEADFLIWKLCREDGMSRIRAWFVWAALRWFARFAAMPSSRRAVERAP